MAESVENGAEASTVSVDVKKDEAQYAQFKAVVLGATGATGRYLVGELLNSKSFSEISLLGRRKLTELPEPFKVDIEKEEESGHLVQQVVDFDAANEENALKYFEGKDVFFSCFGTTRRAAGGNDNFRKIDYGNNVKFAEIAKKAGIRFYSLMSSSGSHSRSFVFYLKVKGQIEEAVTKLEFPLMTIFRPGFLDRLQPPRLLERLAGVFMTKISVAVVAKAMVNDAVIQLNKGKDEHPHSHILGNHQILDLVKGQPKKEDTSDVTPVAEGEKEKAPPSDTEVPKKEEIEAKESQPASKDATEVPPHTQESTQEPVAEDEGAKS